MKRFTLVKTASGSKVSWRLIDDSGVAVQAFEMFANSLASHPQNTRRAYCRSVGQFIDYLAEAESSLKPEANGVWTKAGLSAVVQAYPEWLMMGARSGNAIVKSISASLPSPGLKRVSADLAVAAIKRFMALSERIRREHAELAELGLSAAGPVAGAPLWEGVGERRPIPATQRAAMIKGSVLAGVLAGGPKLIEDWRLPAGTGPVAEYDQERAFPFDQARRLISAFTKPRDRALYAFCAATGCRVHEALQLLWIDIDIPKREARLIDPASRPNHASYLALSAIERDLLAWKGRATSATLMIQPFKDVFFSELAKYLKKDYIAHGRHDFVFQYSTPTDKGRPFFLAAEAGRAETFALAVGKLGLEEPGPFGPHSLRHMYGSYLVNYYPNASGGFGLPIEMVQKLMGHQSLKATQKYAKHDRDLLLAQAQASLYADEANGVSTLEIKRQVLADSLTRVESQIRDQDGPKRLA